MSEHPALPRGQSTSTLQLAGGALALATLIVAGGYFLSRRLLEPPAPSAPPVLVRSSVAADDSSRPTEAVVVAVRGRVERVSESGAVRAAVVGERLMPFDSLRTGVEAEAELGIDERSRLTLTADTEVKVRELTRTVHQLRLKKGRMWARYDADGQRVLRVEDETGTAVAETRSSTFSILANGHALAVATTTGKVNLRAGGDAVDVDAGQQAVAARGQSPSPPAAIPAELLLELARASDPVDALCAAIDGKVEPGSEVRIDGDAIELDASGHFAARVARRAGVNTVRVAVRDVSGHSFERDLGCQSAPRGPAVKLEVNWGVTDAG